MGRSAQVPAELKRGPFTLEEALRAGLTRHCLRGKAWNRIAFGLYRWSGLRDDPWSTLDAWRRVLPPLAAFAGASAAWLHGLDINATAPVEVVVPVSAAIRSRAGLLVHHCEIPPHEVVTVRRLRATALAPTLARLCLQWPAVEALVALDMVVHRRLADRAALIRYAEAAKGKRGSAQMRVLARLAAPAGSPMETRLRWLLIEAGLPHPEVQTELRDGSSRFVGRADLYYPHAGLVLEYDGGNHRDRMVEDDRRQNALVNAGYRLLRFTGADVKGRPDMVVGQVHQALGWTAERRVLPKSRFLRAI